MQARKTFGKRNGPTFAPDTNSSDVDLPRILAYGLSLVVVVGIGALAARASFVRDQTVAAAFSTPTVATAGEDFSLVGLWANNGQTCDETGGRFEFDGDTFWIVNTKLRVAVGPYKVSNSNPIVFEQSGIKIPLAISNNGNSIEPVGYEDPTKTFHLTRC